MILFFTSETPSLQWKTNKKKQPACIPWTGTSRTDTWKPHQAETSSSCPWNMKLGAREKTKFQTKLRCPTIKQELLVYSQSLPTQPGVFSAHFNLPTPVWERRSKPSPLDGDTSCCTPKARLPQKTTKPLWSRPNGVSRSPNHTFALQRSSSEEMLMRKHSQPAGETRQRGVGKATQHH